MKVFYFGCHREAGHYWWRPGMRSLRSEETAGVPWGYWVDSILCPGYVKNEPYRRSKPEIEGEALLHHKDGWTALAFWDRSVDKRGGCNSNFFAEGTHSFDEMVKIAQEHFPEVWKRFPFEVRLAEESQKVAA